MPDHKPLRFSGGPNAALSTAINFVQTNIDRGVECPCCLQRAQRYRRSITSSMAAALIHIHNYFLSEEKKAKRTEATPPEWLHVPGYLSRVYGGVGTRGGDWAKLKYWQLLDPKEDELRADGSHRVGLWKITPNGRLFVRDALKVPKYVYLYDGQINGTEGPQIGIKDALKTKFNYDQLMGFTEGPVAA